MLGVCKEQLGPERRPGTKGEFTSIGKETLYPRWGAALRAFSLVAQSEGPPRPQG